jgi:cytoskeletal protein RodZ
MSVEFASFGARMRYERERRNISIASIAEATKILGALLEGLERDDVSRWPTGFYRRAFMRAYAGAIGLDPDVTVQEFLEHFPDPDAAPPEPPPPPRTFTGVRILVPRLGNWFRER